MFHFNNKYNPMANKCYKSGLYIQWGRRICPMRVVYASNWGGVYFQWRWCIYSMGVAYTFKGGVAYISKDAKMTYTSDGPKVS